MTGPEDEDFRYFRVRPDILHAAGVCGAVALVLVIAAMGLAMHVAFIRAVAS